MMRSQRECRSHCRSANIALSPTLSKRKAMPIIAELSIRQVPKLRRKLVSDPLDPVQRG